MQNITVSRTGYSSSSTATDWQLAQMHQGISIPIRGQVKGSCFLNLCSSLSLVKEKRKQQRTPKHNNVERALAIQLGSRIVGLILFPSEGMCVLPLNSLGARTGSFELLDTMQLFLISHTTHTPVPSVELLQIYTSLGSVSG